MCGIAGFTRFSDPTGDLSSLLKMGDVIASSPLDKVGAVYHASIAGTITEIGPEWIEISK